MDNRLFNIKIYVYELEGKCKYKDMAEIIEPFGAPFDLHRGCLYLAEQLPKAKEALESRGFKIKPEREVSFRDLFNSKDRFRLYRLVYKSFENFLRSKGFEVSRKHKRRHEKVALPIPSVFKETEFVRKEKTSKTAYLVKEGFEFFFFINDGGNVTLRINPRPQILIPNSKISETHFTYTPICAIYKCDNFNDCKIHCLGPVGQPKDPDEKPVEFCSIDDKEFSNMYCYRTREVVAIPKMMLFVEASPANLRRLNIYAPEFETLNKKPDAKYNLTKEIIKHLSDGGKISFSISSSMSLEFSTEFESFGVEIWK
jgi:hypothetical protein